MTVTFRDYIQSLLGVTDLKEMLMDNSQLLNDVAQGLNDMGPAISALLAENASLRGEDTAESAAAGNVKTAFDGLASKFTAEPSLPDVPPVEPTPEPAPADGEQPFPG